MKLTKIYTYYSTLCGDPWLRFSDVKNDGEGTYGHQEHDVDIEILEPSRGDAIGAAVSELRAEQKKHRAEISRLEDRISSLLCLEHKEAA